jgi:hypothetical protein
MTEPSEIKMSEEEIINVLPKMEEDIACLQSKITNDRKELKLLIAIRDLIKDMKKSK